jgi:hypothetical protein
MQGGDAPDDVVARVNASFKRQADMESQLAAIRSRVSEATADFAAPVRGDLGESSDIKRLLLERSQKRSKLAELERWVENVQQTDVAVDEEELTGDGDAPAAMLADCEAAITALRAAPEPVAKLQNVMTKIKAQKALVKCVRCCVALCLCGFPAGARAGLSSDDARLTMRPCRAGSRRSQLLRYCCRRGRLRLRASPSLRRRARPCAQTPSASSSCSRTRISAWLLCRYARARCGGCSSLDVSLTSKRR